MDFLSQWISYHKEFSGVVVAGLFFVGFFGVGFFWEVGSSVVFFFFLKKQRKNHLKFVQGNSQNLLTKMVVLQFRPWVNPVTCTVNQEYY